MSVEKKSLPEVARLMEFATASEMALIEAVEREIMLHFATLASDLERRERRLQRDQVWLIKYFPRGVYRAMMRHVGMKPDPKNDAAGLERRLQQELRELRRKMDEEHSELGEPPVTVVNLGEDEESVMK
jgi:sugar-specific transcriptional regulator TrmB